MSINLSKRKAVDRGFSLQIVMPKIKTILVKA